MATAYRALTHEVMELEKQREKHLLEAHELNKRFFEEIERMMDETGHIMRGGTIVDATINEAPSSTKNAEKSGILRCIRRKRAAYGTLE